MISDFCIRRPIFASVLSIVVTLAGLAALVGLPIEQYPPIAPPQVTVTASFPGADAETVAQAVAAPIETQVNGADNMLYMQSTSSSTGQMTLTVFFQIGTDPDTAQVQVQNRVNIALPRLPDIVQKTGVRVEKRSSSIMMLLAVYAPDGRYDVNYVANYANLYVLDAIKRVPGANQASLFGAADNAMRIWLRPDRMASRGITPTDVQTAIAKQNQQFSAGAIGQSPTSKPVEITVPVVTEGRFNEPVQFENIILRTDPDGAAIVRLGDVGRAEEGLQNYMMRPSLNGKPAVFIAVYQQPGSNALQVAQGIRDTLESLKAGFPDGIDYEVSLDTTKFVSASIEEVVYTLLEAVVLVVLVVYVFLQNLRATLIPTLAVVVSIVGTFVGMTMLGFSINLLTLFGMVLAIGIVVDDAIVVIEAVEANMKTKGLSARDASFLAMREVSGPVVAIVLVLAAVFVPTAFLGGTTGVLYKQFSITVVISVILSGFVALTLTPALAALLLDGSHGQPPKVLQKFNQWFDRLTESYSRGVTWVLKRAVLALAVFAALIVAILWILPDRAWQLRAAGGPGLHVHRCHPAGLREPRPFRCGRSADRRRRAAASGGEICFGAVRVQFAGRPVQDQLRDGLRESQGLCRARRQGTLGRRNDRDRRAQAGRNPGRRRHPDQPAADPGTRHPGRLRDVGAGPDRRRAGAPRTGSAADHRGREAAARAHRCQFDVQPGLAATQREGRSRKGRDDRRTDRRRVRRAAVAVRVALREPVQQVRARVAGRDAGRARVPQEPGGPARNLRARPLRRDGATRRGHDGAIHQGSGPDSALQRLCRGEDQWRTGARLQFRAGHRHAWNTLAADLPDGYSHCLVGPGVRGEAVRRRLGARVRVRSDHGVPDPRRAVRILVAARQRHHGRAVRRARARWSPSGCAACRTTSTSRSASSR